MSVKKVFVDTIKFATDMELKKFFVHHINVAGFF